MIKLFVAQLDYGVTSDALETAFGEYGEVASSHVVTDRETGRSRGFAFVEMKNDEDGMNAIQQLDGASFRGRNIVVKQAEDRRR